MCTIHHTKEKEKTKLSARYSTSFYSVTGKDPPDNFNLVPNLEWEAFAWNIPVTTSPPLNSPSKVDSLSPYSKRLIKYIHLYAIV